MIALIIEPRPHNGMIIAINSVRKQLPDCIIHVIHGNDNKSFLKYNFKNDLYIILHDFNITNMSIEEYNNYFSSNTFISFLKTLQEQGETKLLFFEYDSMLCNSSHKIEEYIEEDYIGALTPYNCMNGGLSLHSLNNFIYISENCNYKYTQNYNFDGILTRNSKTFCKILASHFSVETFFYDNPFGIHKAWCYLSKEDWNKLVKITPELEDLKRSYYMSPILDEHVILNKLRELRFSNKHNEACIIGNYYNKIYPHNYSIIEEYSICAYYNGDVELSYDLNSKILECRNLNDDGYIDRILSNSRFSINSISDRYVYYNREIVDSIVLNKQTSSLPLVTFAITSCKRFNMFEKTINSFLNSCTDILRITNWLCVDDNSSEEDRIKMRELYPFFTFYFKTPEETGIHISMNTINNYVIKEFKTPFLFYLEDNWKFFVKKNYISECIEVLGIDTMYGQCVINKNYTEIEEDIVINGGILKKSISGLRYYLHNSGVSKNFLRPSLIKTSVLKSIGLFAETIDFEKIYNYNFYICGYKTVFLENLYCIILYKNYNYINSSVSALNIKKFVINLDRRNDRYTKFCNINNTILQNIETERVSAIDGFALKPTEQLYRIFKHNTGKMRKGETGCTMSHLKLYIDLINSENELICIFEDDAILIPSFNEKLNFTYSQLCKTDWDICFLGFHIRHNIDKSIYYSKELYPIIEKYTYYKSCCLSTGGTHGYLITKKGAIKMLERINFLTMHCAIDSFLQECSDTLNIYYLSTVLVHEGGDEISDIQPFYYEIIENSEDKRLLSEFNFYDNNIEQVNNYQKMIEYINDENKVIVFYYKDENKNNIDRLINDRTSLHQFKYTIGENIIIVVPNPSEYVRSHRDPSPLKINGVFNIDNCFE